MRADKHVPWSGAAIVTWAAIFLFAPSLAVSAEDAKVGCGELIAKARADGVTGSAVIDKEWGLVRAAIPGMFCVEPTEEWRPRRLGWPSQAGSVYSPPANLAESKSAPKAGNGAPAPAPAAPKTASAKPAPPKPVPAKPVLPKPVVAAPVPAVQADVPAPPPPREAATPAPRAETQTASPASDGSRSFTVDTSKSMLKRVDPAPVVKGAPVADAEPEPAADVSRISITPDLAAEHRDVAAGKATLAPAGISGAIEETASAAGWIVWVGIGLVVVLAAVTAVLIFRRLRRHRAEEDLHSGEDDEDEEAA